MEEARKLKTVGAYTLSDAIGEGSFSIVRKAYLTNGSNEIYACKIIPKIKFRERNLAVRFQFEIRVMQALHHPNIVQIYDIFKDKQFYYVIMEYVKGGTLFDYICNNRRIGENKAKDFMYQIFKAIEYIHSLGICHRDLKLENILLSEDYSTLKISDFGLSKFLHKDGLTKTPVGSPLYASPECLSGQPYDARKSDIWSCGVIMYVLLSGKMPWLGKTQSHVFSQIKQANYEMPSYFSTDCKKLIRSILTNDPKKRLSATEVLKSKWLTIERTESNILTKPNKLISLKSLDSFFQKDMKSRISSASFECLLTNIHNNEKSLIPKNNQQIISDEKNQKKDEITTEKKESRKYNIKLKKVPSTTSFDVDFDKKLHSILFEKVEFPVSVKKRSSLPPKIKKKIKHLKESLQEKDDMIIDNQDTNQTNCLSSRDTNTNNLDKIGIQAPLKHKARCNSHAFISFTKLTASHTSTSDNFNDYNSSKDESNHSSRVENHEHSDDKEILSEIKVQNSNVDTKESNKTKKQSKYKNKKEKNEKKSKKDKKDKKRKHSKRKSKDLITTESVEQDH